MKYYLIIFAILTLSSCSISNLYQVYTMKSPNVITNKDTVKFENDDCIIIYNLWANSGNSGFTFYNKSAADLVIDLSKSFYVLNGTSFEYFQNRKVGVSLSHSNTGTMSYSSRYYNSNEKSTNATATAVTKGSTSSNYVEYQEKQFITVPSTCSVYIKEFAIVSTPYKTCEFPKNKTKDDIGAAVFTEQTAPITFSNIISYSKDSENHRITNSFYVKEIANYGFNDITVMKRKTDCNKPLMEPYRIFRNPDADKFYLKYNLK